MPFVVYAYLAVQILIVAYHDFQTKKISNKWSLINIGFFLFFTLIFPEFYSFSIETFIWPLGFFAAGFILFLMKIMGGGDSKYLASFYLLIPSVFHEQAFFSLSIATVLVGGSVFIKNIMKNADLIVTAFRNKDVKMVRAIFGKKFAFAPVIFISWIWFGWIIKERMLF